MNASSSALMPMPFVALPTSTGARIESRTPRWRQVSSSSSLISSPSRYFAITSSSASAAASRSWSRRRATSSASSSGTGISTSLPPSQRVGLAVDEIDVPRERLGLADRDVERRDLVPERSRQRVERGGGSAFSRSHLFRKKQAARPVERPRRDRGLEPGLDAAPTRPSRTARRRRRRSPTRPRPRSPGSRACRRA